MQYSRGERGVLDFGGDYGDDGVNELNFVDLINELPVHFDSESDVLSSIASDVDSFASSAVAPSVDVFKGVIVDNELAVSDFALLETT